MLNNKQLTRKVLLGLLSSPMTVVPLVLGATLLMGLWAFSIQSGMAWFAALALILGAFGTFLTRLLLGSDAVEMKALAELQREAHQSREQALDELDGRLTGDDDPRTEACLRDLRTLTKAFNEHGAQPESLNPRSVFEVLSGVERLFERCVHSLKRTLTLWETAQKMATEQARRPILDEREKVVEDIQESISQLGTILAGIQSLRTTGRTDSDLARIREELDQSLAVARRVEERMRALDKSPEGTPE